MYESTIDTTQPTTRPAGRPRGRLFAVGVVAAGLSVVGAGVAAAASAAGPDAPPVAAPAEVAEVQPRSDVVVTPEVEAQLQAFWDAGFTSGDLDALVELWQVADVEAKARAGALVLTGEAVPVAPGTHPDAFAEGGPADAFWDAGYTYDDAVALAALWGTDVVETKASAGQKLLDGESLPIAPGSSVPTAP